MSEYIYFYFYFIFYLFIFFTKSAGKVLCCVDFAFVLFGIFSCLPLPCLCEEGNLLHRGTPLLMGDSVIIYSHSEFVNCIFNHTLVYPPNRIKLDIFFMENKIFSLYVFIEYRVLLQLTLTA